MVSLCFISALKAQEVPPVAPVPPAPITEMMPPIATENPQQKLERFITKSAKVLQEKLKRPMTWHPLCNLRFAANSQ